MFIFFSRLSFIWLYAPHTSSVSFHSHRHTTSKTALHVKMLHKSSYTWAYSSLLILGGCANIKCFLAQIMKRINYAKHICNINVYSGCSEAIKNLAWNSFACKNKKFWWYLHSSPSLSLVRIFYLEWME